ncbi:MAG: LamG-like jellyroll fold domain-containing protein [Verrucomicrobiota bacterium]
MKIRVFKWILFTLSVVGFLSVAPGSATAALVARFRFDGSLNDETGNHNGATFGGGTADFDTGESGQALVVASAGDAIEVANPATLDFGNDFTISAWVNSAHQGEQVVAYRGDAAHFAAPTLQFNLQGAKGFFIYGEGQGSFGANFDTDGLSATDGTWHHVAVTYSSTATPHFTLYLDGKAKHPGDPGSYFAGDFVTQHNLTNSVVRIGGRDADSGDYHFNGLLDEVQIYDRGLAADQITFLFNNPDQVILPPAIPAITTQPVATQTVALGATVNFSVVAEARTPLSYQWQFNGNNLLGQNNATLTLTNVTIQQAGPYTVVVSATAGSVTSSPAILAIAGGPTLDLHLYAGITIDGTVGLNYRVDYTESLAPTTNWLALTNLTLTSSPFLLFDIQSTNSPKRFYRAVLIP